MSCQVMGAIGGEWLTATAPIASYAEGGESFDRGLSAGVGL